MFRKKINSLGRYLIFLIGILATKTKGILNLKYKKLSDKPPGTSEIEETSDRDISINNITVNNILKKLTKFENSKKFLKKDISLTSLSGSLNTNPRYLSEIIKHYKGRSFNNYLNGLRIQYIIQLLYKEPIYREYKITYLAEHCGFSSREVFAAAFKRETGVTPSYFISQFRTTERK